MMFPIRLTRRAGVERAGLLNWISTGDDPQFVIGLGALRPRYLVLMMDDARWGVEPKMFFDRGDGFGEADSEAFGHSGRLVCLLHLHYMKDVRRIRIDPTDQPGRFRFLAIGCTNEFVAKRLCRIWSGPDLPSGPNRFFALRAPNDIEADPRSKAEHRVYRSVEEHFADVLALRPAAGPGNVGAPPLLSLLVPTYNTSPAYLDDLLTSFTAQEPGWAELVLSDDGSTNPETLEWLDGHRDIPNLKIVVAPANAGIARATNRALEAATGLWVALVDHDDALAPGAIQMIVSGLRSRPDAMFLYTDEVITNPDLQPIDYFLKPAFDPVLLSGMNYVNHLSVYRCERLRDIGGLRDGFQGSQDYDLLLRYLAGVDPDAVIHLPYPAYLWRRHPESFSSEFQAASIDSARRALGEAYAARDRSANVQPALGADHHRVRFDQRERAWPRVSVIIPNRDAPQLLQTVLAGLAITDYPDLDVIVVDNDSRDPATLALYAEYRAAKLSLKVVPATGPFNFSRSINLGVAAAGGELLLLLNNDIEMKDAGWLREMVSCLDYPGTGIVGARLLYPNGTLQHAGVIVGLRRAAGHWYSGKIESAPGPMGRLGVRQSMSAVTAAAMLIDRRCWEATGPFDETSFAVAYNDVDFCLRAGKAGFRTVWTPFATLIHHESASRGSDATVERIDGFRREQDALRARHGTDQFVDPAYSPWYTLHGPIPGLRALEALPAPR